MSRKKILNKKQTVSISITPQQKQFILNHPKFDLSKFVQIHLEDHIQLTYEVERIEREVNLDVKAPIN